MKILFVCLGNICRSQMAEAMLRHRLKEMQQSGATGSSQLSTFDAQFEIDSAGTSDEEEGNPMYPPARQCLKSHGIEPGNHRARQITRADYDRFDMIILMEEANRRQMRHIIAADPDAKISLLLDHAPHADHRDIADPWYTGGFEATYRDIRQGLDGLINVLL